MISDANKCILNISYNHLDTLILEKNYVAGYIYKKDAANGLTLALYNSAEGRVRKEGSSFKFEYVIKDHLGNVRVTFIPQTISGNLVATVNQHDSYYPFGLRFASTVTGSENKFTYNGKEYEDDFNLNWYHGVYPDTSGAHDTMIRNWAGGMLLILTMSFIHLIIMAQIIQLMVLIQMAGAG